MHKKTGRCARYLLENEPIFRFLAWLITQPLIYQRPAARSYGQKSEILARFKESNARSAPFVLVCVGMTPVNNISARNFSSREIGGPAQHLRAGVGERKWVWVNGGMISDSRSLLSAGECLVVRIVTLCAVKINSLTPLVGLSTAAARD
jgi:hypothetical protein